MRSVEDAQRFMRLNGIHGWVLPDFRGSNAVLWDVLGSRGFTTRRCVLFIPQSGEPQGLLNILDEPQSGALFPSQTTLYRNQEQYLAWLRERIQPDFVVATEYSMDCAIPTLSLTDAGTMDILKSLATEVVGSESLLQAAFATWADESLEAQKTAISAVTEILEGAFQLIGSRLRNGQGISEFDVQQHILEKFAAAELETFEEPVVAVNANSGKPHYMPSAELFSPIQKGDWLLVDLWAKRKGDQAVYADITWVASVGTRPSPRHEEIFAIVRNARDAVVERLREAWGSGYSLAGWQLDDVARKVIADAGYGDYFLHRTGHSMAPGPVLHALGVNIDNFETHDTRLATPGVGFSVEPGIYLPEFGVRSEVDVYIHPQRGPEVTSPLQSEIQVIPTSY